MPCVHFNVNRRNLALASFAIVLLCPHLAWAQAGKSGDDVPALKAVKERTDQIKAGIETELPSLEQLYMHLHSHPELSYQEEKTSATLAKELKDQTAVLEALRHERGMDALAGMAGL